jgi:hypothetical protein
VPLAFVSGGPAQSEVRWRLHTAISSRFGRLIAAVSSLESTDITDKWAARLDCVPMRHGFPPRTQAHRAGLVATEDMWRWICGVYAGRKLSRATYARGATQTPAVDFSCLFGRAVVRCGVQVRVCAPPRRLSPGLDFRDRPLHCLIHSAANLMVGLRHTFLVEVLA